MRKINNQDKHINKEQIIKCNKEKRKYNNRNEYTSLAAYRDERNELGRQSRYHTKTTENNKQYMNETYKTKQRTCILT